MPYTHTTWTALQTALSQRLQDTAQNFWTATEIPLYLSEALRTFGVLSGFWRERSTLTLTASTAFFDLMTQTVGFPTLTTLIGSAVTDRDIIQLAQFALLESASDQATWPGTAQFTYNDVSNAVIRRRNQFLADTGIILTRSTQAVSSPAIGRAVLGDTIIDVRRCAFQGATPFDYYSTMWRTDERELVLADSSWNVNSGTPRAFSVLGPPPLLLQMAPPPLASGTLDLVTVNASPTLDPATSATALGIPDDLTPAIKWGVLADLLGIDGQSRDPARASFCEQRYQQFVQLARMLPLVVNAEIQGASTIPTTLADLDNAVPNWQNVTGTPSYLALAGWNLLAVYPVADGSGPYSATVDVVRKAPIPTVNSPDVQLGREQLDMILDYAEHLALFKVGGYEFAVTARQADNFLVQSITYNQRLAASARYIIAPKRSSQREKEFVPRRSQSDGLGAMPSIQEAQSFVTANVPERLRER